ncbi:DUF4097 domain-containing protein [Streptomyces sp. N2-109]|uniref:DUF4097 domain-containing protein n=1 Tax=Streptomyces gossypii TaxID=2883101 RepID=A0ABT2JMH2_9ACTN|nr:DUF4097 domain-containing protein [Streptomyces gossypii]MCT2589079.1 DUF4097 domain-containing protein [Streptomyces gossypii]
MKKTTAAGALALGLTMITGAALSGCSTEEVSDGKAEHRSFAFTGKRLTVDSGDSKVEVVPVRTGGKGGKAGSERKAEVTRWFKASKVKGTAKVSWTMEGNTLRLKTTCSGIIVDCETRHRIEVPDDTAVTVRSRDGNVVANGFRAELSIRTTDGNVNVSDARAPLTIRTTDGNVRAERLRSPSVSADTRDGYLILGFSRPPSSVRTGSHDGSTTVTAPRTPYDISTNAKDGSVKVSLPRDKASDRAIDASSHDGDITLRASEAS